LYCNKYRSIFGGQTCFFSFIYSVTPKNLQHFK
jgi:hypothetical protein